MRNAGLPELQAGIKIGGRNINNYRYANDTSLKAENEEELKILLMRVKEESEKSGLRLTVKKKKKKQDRGIQPHHCMTNSRVFVTLWTVVCQAPLYMGFSRQEYWSGLPSPPPGDLLDPWIDSHHVSYVFCIGRPVLYN